MHFSCEDIFKNQRFQYIKWEEKNIVTPFLLNSSYWTPFTPKFSHRPNTVNICAQESLKTRQDFILLPQDLPFSYKDGEWISTSLHVFCVAEAQMLYDSNSDGSRKYLLPFLILHFCYSSMFDHSLPEEIPTTLELTEMALIIIVCGYQSLQIFTDTNRTKDVPKCVLEVVMGKGKEKYRNTGNGLYCFLSLVIKEKKLYFRFSSLRVIL